MVGNPSIERGVFMIRHSEPPRVVRLRGSVYQSWRSGARIDVVADRTELELRVLH